jgi:hypothetical protein
MFLRKNKSTSVWDVLFYLKWYNNIVS